MKMTVQEFQAVILAAGQGARMKDLTNDKPKCLLPVGDKPVLCHSINTLEEAGFNDVFILILEQDASQIQHALQQYNVKINYKLVPIPTVQFDEWGTADSLKYLIKQEKIKRDVLLMSCDLFTNTNIKKLLCTYRKHRASFAALFFLPSPGIPNLIPGSGIKTRLERDVVGIDADTSRLVFIASAMDFEDNIKLKEKILRRHPKVSLRCDLVDGHVYIFSYGLLKFLTGDESITVLKGEFLPYIVSKQNHRPYVGNDESSVVDEASKNSVIEFVKGTKLDEDIIDSSAYNDHKRDLKKAYLGDLLRCYAVIADSQDFGIRINTLQYFVQANDLCIKGGDNESSENVPSKRIHPSASIESNQIDTNSFIGAGSKIKDKTSIKLSTLGENCVVSPKSRLNKCIIMKNVFINEGCTLESCILADDVKVGRGCELKNCIVGSGHNVPDGTKGTNNLYCKTYNLMGF